MSRLARLVERWEQVADAVEAGYPLGLEDWLDDMDGRQKIDDADAAGKLTARLVDRVSHADRRLRSALEPAQRCLWGTANAAASGWNREHHWWYFEQPRRPGSDLAHDLARVVGRS